MGILLFALSCVSKTFSHMEGDEDFWKTEASPSAPMAGPGEKVWRWTWTSGNHLSGIASALCEGENHSEKVHREVGINESSL